MKAKKNAGSGAFDDYYAEVWGDRWPGLKAALLREASPQAFERNLIKPYYMDKASMLVAESLGASDGERVLDMCAAPGGKSLVIASMMFSGLGIGGENSEEAFLLTCNERSNDRRMRLLRVLDEHLPVDTRKKIRVTGFDAAQWCRYEKAAYDRILLDAPCSSERHVLNSKTHLDRWSPARPKSLAIAQWALLSSAFRSLKPGGTLVYSTCAISRVENESVIERLLDRFEGEVSLDLALPDGFEARDLGAICLPDKIDPIDRADGAARLDGSGPLYFCKLRKLPA